MTNLNKIRKYFTEKYDFDKTTLSSWDYVAAGTVVGLTLASVKSVFLFILVILFIAHMTFKK